MNHARWIGKAAWGLAFVVLVEIALVVVLESTLGPDETYFPVTTALSMIGFGAWAVVAAIVVSRQAAHVVGWLLLAATFFGVSGTLSEVIALRIAAEGGSLGAARSALALGTVGFVWLLLSLAMLFLVFPNGHLSSSRWRPVVWAVALAGVVNTVFVVLISTRVVDVGGLIRSSYSMDQAGTELPSWLLTLGTVSDAVLVASLVAGGTALVLRLKSAEGSERQQVKWVVYSGVIAVGAMVVFFSREILPATSEALELLAFAVMASSLGAGFAIALFRYRLYDIDRIINRTVVYSAVVTLLAAVYVAAVFVLRVFLPDSGDLAVAASTLAVAALFNPARRRVQRFVDRRFYRSQYNAPRIVQDFSARLRNELDLTELTTDLLRTVDQAVKPASANVWIRPNNGSAKTNRTRSLPAI